MNPETPVSNSSPDHCQHRSASGRRFCRLPISDPQSGLCFRHASQSKADAQAAQAARLLGETGEFRSAADINRSLGELYKLLARDEIAPRRAAVMAYTCSLLLRTLPAIEQELAGAPQRIIIDMPGPTRDDEPMDPERAMYQRAAELYGKRPDRPGPETASLSTPE